jgi:hypothetical protein
MIEAPHTKDPRCIARGQAAAVSRWGEPRQINLRDLSDAERRIVLASIAAIRAERLRDAAAEQAPTT